MRAHIFDADGVIFDSERAHARCFSAYASLFGIELTEQDFLDRFRGQIGRQIMTALFPRASALEIEQHVDDRNRLFRSEFISQVSLVEGIAAFLERLETARMGMIVVSNGTRENVESMLAAHGLKIRALAIEDFTVPKPDPAGYAKALEVLGVPASQSVVYEDTPLGITAAKRAGIRVVGIASYSSKQQLIDAGADSAIDDFTALL